VRLDVSATHSCLFPKLFPGLHPLCDGAVAVGPDPGLWLAGNVITQEMIDKLKPGMTRSQVAYVMGEPVVRNTFDDSRWDYVYTLENPGRYEVSSGMSLYFENNKLAYFTGNLAPSSVQAAAKDEAADPEAVAEVVEAAIQAADEAAGRGDDINAAGSAQSMSAEAENELKR